MYVPVENVYYELTCGGSSALLDYAHSRRVFLVSPTTFTAYLQVIVLGPAGNADRGARTGGDGDTSRELGTDFARFKDDFDLVGTHLGRAQTKFADADKRLDKFEVKLERRRAGERLPARRRLGTLV